MPAENGVRSDAYEPSADECHDSVQRGEGTRRARDPGARGVLVVRRPPSPLSPLPFTDLRTLSWSEDAVVASVR